MEGRAFAWEVFLWLSGQTGQPKSGDWHEAMQTIEISDRARAELPQMFKTENGPPTIRVYVTGHG